MSAATLLDRLDGVQACGDGRWRARCPVCQSRSALVTPIKIGGVLKRLSGESMSEREHIVRIANLLSGDAS